MFNKFILLFVIIFCIAFEVSASSIHDQSSVIQREKYLVNPEMLFIEDGILFLQTERCGAQPLKSVSFDSGRCFIAFPSEIIESEYYQQGYRCNGCGYTFVKTNPGPPGTCPVCKKYDWTVF